MSDSMRTSSVNNQSLTTPAMPPKDVFDQDDWWQTGGDFKLLHDINPIRMDFVTTLVNHWSGKRLFDLGCGGGIFCETAAMAGARVVGVDSAAGAIEAARSHAKLSGLDITYHQQSGIGQQKASSYDVVTCFEMLEHVHNPDSVVADCATLLAPGGIAVFSTINRTLRAWALVIAGLEVMGKVLPTGTHDYNKFIKPTDLANYCRRSNLSIITAKGLRYSFFGRCYLLDDRDFSVNYFLVAKRL